MKNKVRNLIARAAMRRPSSGPMKLKNSISRKKQKEILKEKYFK